MAPVMQKTMRALLKKERAEGLRLEEVPVPEIGINDVLIKVLKSSICGTDVHIWNWDEWAQKTIPVPMIVGHEFVGEVAALGSNVSDLEIGDMQTFFAIRQPATESQMATAADQFVTELGDLDQRLAADGKAILRLDQMIQSLCF